MVDFNALLGSDKSSSEIDPIKIFEELPKSNKINDLYNVQAEILRKWHGSLRGKSDVVIQLNTGGGKTLIGLLMALSIMREIKEGVLYLVENKQLAEQVVQQARELGIPAKTYGGHSSVDADFDNGKTILVGSYECLFNGKSVFGLRGSGCHQAIGGIIIDDAHASLGALRDVFSLTIPAEGPSEDLYKDLLNEFRDAFNETSHPFAYDDFMHGAGEYIVEIPYPRWVDALKRVSELIRKEWQDRDRLDDEFSLHLKFCWPLLKDNLRYCQAIASRNSFSVTSLYPIVEMVPSFVDAKRRIFMSATITDYGDMVRAYGISGLEKDCVVAPRSVAGVGRRMILDLGKDTAQDPEFACLVKTLASNGQGVVRLVGRRGTDEKWPSIAFREPIGHPDVLSAVSDLQSGRAKTPISFVNRYNGIDLPDDSCRILVFRDLPIGGRDSEKLMSMYLKDSELITRRMAQTIEQGLGRGTRGASDHCVVLLEGERLVDWVRRDRNKKYFSPALRAQLEVGEEVMRAIHAPKDLCEAIQQDLDGDESWRKFHASRLAKAVSGDDVDRFGESWSIAKLERNAFVCWMEHRYDDAQEMLVKKARECGDNCYGGWLLYLASRIAFDAGKFSRADDLQGEAHQLNRMIPYEPPTFLDGVPEWALRQARLIISRTADKSAAFLECFDRETENLTAEAEHEDFENSLMKLGYYLGFDSNRADDNGSGPDVYWVTSDNIGLVLEAKNEKKADTNFHKKDAGQLRTARDWLKEKRPTIDVVPVSVHPSTIADRNASASNLRVMNLESLNELKNKTRQLLESIDGGRIGVARDILGLALGGKLIVDNYTKPFNDAE